MIDIKGIIFDLDGVIISTDEFHYIAWKKIADQEGIPFDRIKNNQLRGISRMNSLDIILKNAKKIYSKEEKEKLCEEKNNIYKKELKSLSNNDLKEDVKNTLKYLKDCGYKLGIGSSSKNTQFILSQIGLDGFFDTVVTGWDIKKSKPDPEVFLLAATKLKIDPEKLAVVEDSLSGIEAAKKGGFLPIGISYATTSSLCEIKINNLSDLKTILKVNNYE